MVCRTGGQRRMGCCTAWCARSACRTSPGWSSIPAAISSAALSVPVVCPMSDALSAARTSPTRCLPLWPSISFLPCTHLCALCHCNVSLYNMSLCAVCHSVQCVTVQCVTVCIVSLCAMCHYVHCVTVCIVSLHCVTMHCVTVCIVSLCIVSLCIVSLSIVSLCALCLCVHCVTMHCVTVCIVWCDYVTAGFSGRGRDKVRQTVICVQNKN